MKKRYLEPKCGAAIIPYTLMVGTVSTGTSNLPAEGIPGTTTGGIGQGAPKKV